MGEYEMDFDGNIPVLSANGESMPETWENSLVALHDHGIRYARGGPKDQGKMQTDSTMTMAVNNPGSDDFFHKYIGTVPPQNLFAYAFEFLGAKDCLAVDPRYDPEGDTRWEYTYHLAFERYNEGIGKTIDQIAEVIERLADKPHKRNSQMITWRPEKDLHEDYPACMQRGWFFPVPMPDGSFKLNANYHFRSRNPMTAAPMNLFGESVFQSYIADMVQERMQGKPEQQVLSPDKRILVVPGRLCDITDSYHVSSRDLPLLEKFIEQHHASVEKEEEISDRAYGRDLFFPLFRDFTQTGEVKHMIQDEISNRYAERIESNPGLVDQLCDEKDRELARLDEIESWLIKFLG
jgi:thymidylate synthase